MAERVRIDLRCSLMGRLAITHSCEGGDGAGRYLRTGGFEARMQFRSQRHVAPGCRDRISPTSIGAGTTLDQLWEKIRQTSPVTRDDREIRCHRGTTRFITSLSYAAFCSATEISGLSTDDNKIWV